MSVCGVGGVYTMVGVIVKLAFTDVTCSLGDAALVGRVSLFDWRPLVGRIRVMVQNCAMAWV